jgi:hypothetical protein
MVGVLSERVNNNIAYGKGNANEERPKLRKDGGGTPGRTGKRGVVSLAGVIRSFAMPDRFQAST